MNRKPLIAHVLYRLDTGGMEQIVISVINRTRGRYRHAVICLAGFGAMRNRIEDAAIPCVSLNKKPGKDWPYYFRLWRVLRALKPDLVQTYNIGTLDLMPVVKLAGVRQVVHAEHGRDVADPEGRSLKYRRLRRCMAPLVGRYVVVSPDLQRWLIDRVGIRSSKVVYIPNGTDVASFDGARDRAGSRRLSGDLAPPGTVLVGNVARLDRVKDHAGLLAAFKILSGQDARCRLVIAGDGPQRRALEQQITRLGLTGRVRLLGNRDDVPELLGECDVFVLSSIAEGMPVTVLEAMAAGLPVVATRVGGNASVVMSGKTGTLVPASDPQALAAAIGAYVADEKLRHRHGDAGRARAAARFGLGTMTAAYEALYDHLLGSERAPQAPVSGLNDPGEH